jgi:hypothetical protein
LIAKGTLDEIIWLILNKKLNILNEIGLNREILPKLAVFKKLDLD